MDATLLGFIKSQYSMKSYHSEGVYRKDQWSQERDANAFLLRVVASCSLFPVFSSILSYEGITMP